MPNYPLSGGFSALFPMHAMEEEAKPRPLKEAQAHELRLRFGRMSEGPLLKRGDLCVEKDGLQVTTQQWRRGEGTVFLFVRYLDFSEWRDREVFRAHLRSGRVSIDSDCVVGYLDDDGDLVASLHSSTHLMPYTGDGA